jgi:hypothetical protein
VPDGKASRRGTTVVSGLAHAGFTCFIADMFAQHMAELFG